MSDRISQNLQEYQQLSSMFVDKWLDSLTRMELEPTLMIKFDTPTTIPTGNSTYSRVTIDPAGIRLQNYQTVIPFDHPQAWILILKHIEAFEMACHIKMKQASDARIAHEQRLLIELRQYRDTALDMIDLPGMPLDKLNTYKATYGGNDNISPA